MNNELEKMWKGVIMAHFKVLPPEFYMEGLRRPMKTTG
jgi:hypothetical protein